MQSTALIALQSAREGIDRQLEDLQTKVTKAETERTDVKNKAAKDKSSYELRISELQNKLSQVRWVGHNVYLVDTFPSVSWTAYYHIVK